jgi:hypothetical protein
VAGNPITWREYDVLRDLEKQKPHADSKLHSVDKKQMLEVAFLSA